MDLNPVDYIDILKEKSTFLIHGIYDKDVNYRRSKNLHQELKNGSGKHELYLSKQEGHIVARHLSQEEYYKRIVNWL